MEDMERDILEEVVLPEREGILTSKRYSTTAAGTVRRETRLPFCDYGGERISEGEQTIVCCEDRKKLCKYHAIKYLERNYCLDCLQRHLPLSRLQFKILHGLIKGLQLHRIKEIARSRVEELRAALDELKAQGYVEKKGISLFSYYEAVDRGILAWKTYSATFANSDVAHFIEEVENHLKEVEHSHVERSNRERH
jgi:hypothetical protein